MRTPSTSPRSAWSSLWLGFALGAVAVALLAVAVVLGSLLLGAQLLFILSAGFDDKRTLLILVGIVLTTLVVGAALIWLLSRLVPGLAQAGGLGARGGAAAAAGAVLSLALAVWVMPEPIKSTALQFATGETAAQRAAQPAADAARQRLHDLLAAQPGGPEAALLAAVNLVAEPVVASGRVWRAADVAAKVDALRRLRPTLPSAWQPVLLGAMAKLQRTHFGSHPVDGAMRDTLFEAGRAGSSALMVLAAQEEEGIAHHHEINGRVGLADAAWRRAFEGYAAAGVKFEVERLLDETLPERLRTLHAPAAARAVVPDAALSQRLWRFAQAIGDDAANPHATPGQRELAVVVGLVAMERAPDAPHIATQNPARRWSDDPWALGRWMLALRHARGDCMAALDLSDATRQRRRPAVVNRDQPPASSLDMAWALAWAEAAEACVRSGGERRQVSERRANLDYLVFKSGELDAARVGVAATLATLR